MAEESIIARTSARDYQRISTLVLTTERVLAIGHDGVVWSDHPRTARGVGSADALVHRPVGRIPRRAPRVRLGDGRWVYFDHQVDITGEAYSTTIVARSLDTLWWGALTEGQRERLTRQITRERLDEELVQLDALLESSDRNVVSHAEHRMRQIRRLR